LAGGPGVRSDGHCALAIAGAFSAKAPPGSARWQGGTRQALANGTNDAVVGKTAILAPAGTRPDECDSVNPWKNLRPRLQSSGLTSVTKR
jgi:hypothetical protein